MPDHLSPSRLLVYFQLLFITIAVLVAAINLTLYPTTNKEFWVSLLVYCIALLIPFPNGIGKKWNLFDAGVERPAR